MSDPMQAQGVASSALSQAAARDLTDQIRTGMESIYHLIRAAYTGRAWAALGYGSWDEYITREFGNLHLRPPLEDRHDIVLSLREVGMSTRAIAAATQLSDRTVRRELDARVGSGAANAAPDGAASTVRGTDGKAYQARPCRQPQTVSDCADNAAALEEKSAFDAVLDMPADDFGVNPLDLGRRADDERARVRRMLTIFNGSGAGAVQMLMKATAPLGSLVSPVTGQSAVENDELHGVVWDSARCVRALAHVIRVVGHTEGESREQIRSTLRDALDDLDGVLKEMEGATR